MSDPHHQLKNSLNYFQHTSNTENSIDPVESNSSTTYSINIENPLESTKRTSFSIAKSDESNQLPNRLPTRDTLATSSTPSPPQQKNPSILQRLIDKAKLPEFHQMRKTIKASFALLIAMVFIFDYHTRKVVSTSVLLVGIVTIFYFPVRTIGIQTEAVLLGTLGGGLASGWSLLGSFLASLARDKFDPNPVQAGACAILAVFLFIGVFILNLIRIKFPKANFGTVIACIVLTFSMTFSAGFNEFTPEVIWQLLLPVLVAGAICLAINYLIWPDDSINNFLGISRKTLAGYNSFFKEHTDAFLQDSPVNHNVTLPTLSAHLKNGILLMIECKRAVKREILFSRISDVDCSEISNLITNMRSPLHGIGVSLMLKNNYVYSENKNMFFNKFIDPVTMDAFTTSLKGIRPISKELSDLCYNATNQASIRLANLHYPPRTTLNSILWPFPRLWVSKKATTTTNKNCIGQTEDPVSTSILYETIHQLDEISKSNKVFCKFLGLNATQLPRNGPLYLLFLYIFSLRQHALSVVSLLKLIEKLEARRVKPRIWLPHQTLKKWIMSNSEVGGSVGGNENDYENQPGGNDLARVGTLQSNSHDSESNDVFEAKSSRIRKKQTKFADPDVSAPITPMQKFFYLIYLFLRWLTNTSTLFAIKTAIGVVMMAIPAWMPQNHEWYISWRGQWGMITLVLWMFPMTGAFVFGILYRIIGSVIGAVLGIIVWEMCRGNAYGMAIVCFILFLPLYYIFFFIPKYRVIALMTKVTMILVVSYEYSYVLEGLPGYDKVYTVAGKRLLLVIIGIAAGGILISLPYPPTGRVELRKKIANTMRDIGKCYGILYASTISPAGVKASPTVSKDFRKLTLQLRRQVAEERALLQHTAYEPPLRGYFHSESYKILVEKMDHLSDLVTNMGFALREVRSEWRKNIASILLQERKDYLSAILTSAKLISSTLAAKTALPPYMISPIDARQRFTSLLEKKIMTDAKDIANPSFSSYSAYLMNGLVFVDELEKVLNVTKDLVGIEDPDEWIRSRS